MVKHALKVGGAILAMLTVSMSVSGAQTLNSGLLFDHENCIHEAGVIVIGEAGHKHTLSGASFSAVGLQPRFADLEPLQPDGVTEPGKAENPEYLRPLVSRADSHGGVQRIIAKVAYYARE